MVLRELVQRPPGRAHEDCPDARVAHPDLRRATHGSAGAAGLSDGDDRRARGEREAEQENISALHGNLLQGYALDGHANCDGLDNQDAAIENTFPKIATMRSR